ncbi:MAG TPA: alpha-L-fucosidase [Pseudomonadales bacterium]|nr:alpha-L-fucosidase [Pseudomonadales bacterium]
MSRLGSGEKTLRCPRSITLTPIGGEGWGEGAGLKIQFIITFLALALLLPLNVCAQNIPLPAPPQDTPITAAPDAVTEQKLAWWTNARFGMFIHWGLYSQDGCFYKGTNGGSEHMMQHLQIPLADYAKIADDFDPTNFDADAIVDIAKNAGMKYIIFTSKHHDGFAMYDSESNDYNIVKRTPWQRDPVAELAAACHRKGLKFGVYYSLGRDWADPDVPTKNGYRSNTWDYPDESKKVFSKYFARKVKPQITELLTHYGPIDVIWFDTPEEISAAESKELVELIHQLQPNCIINSRVGHGLGDYNVSEQKIPGTASIQPWETCMTLNGHWAYFKGDEKWKSPATIIHNLVDIASKGGNYLLNVGPTGKGIIPQGAVKDLQAVGEWMQANGKSIYGTTASSLPQPSWGRTTQKGTTLYLHVFDWPKNGKLMVQGFAGQNVNVSFLTYSMALTATAGSANKSITINLPPKPLDPIDTVIVLQK